MHFLVSHAKGTLLTVPVFVILRKCTLTFPSTPASKRIHFFAGLLSIAISENLQNELVSQLYKDSAMGEMMRETPDVARRRGEIQEMRGLLQRALNIVNEVRDFNTFVPGAK